MYTLYIANKNYSSWSLRPWVLMRALDISFTECLQRFPDGSTEKPAEFRVFSPSGKVPCLHDGDTVVWDSLAIVEYLAERHPGVWPSDPRARAWARCAAAEMHSGFGALRSRCSMSCGVRIEMSEVPVDLAADLERLGALWSEGLGRFGGAFLAGGAFCAVDAFFAPVAFRVQTYGLALDAPAMAYVDRLLAFPAMQQWYADALAERFRDVPHEAELVHLGRVTADYRAAAE